jgi:hypothetical protein
MHKAFKLGRSAIGCAARRAGPDWLMKARGRQIDCRAALTVFDISIAMVIGPTPPGTGVQHRQRAGNRACRFYPPRG